MTTTRNAGWTLPGPRRTPGFHDAGIFEVAPLVCVVLTMLVTMYMLYATGFLEACADGKVLEEFSWAFEKPDGSLIETENVATRRGGLALSGVLLAATVVLSLTALLWVYANRTKLWDARGLRKTIIQGFVLCSLVATTLLYWHPFIGGDISFVSSLSWALLETTRTQMPEATWRVPVPAARGLRQRPRGLRALPVGPGAAPARAGLHAVHGRPRARLRHAAAVRVAVDPAGAHAVGRRREDHDRVVQDPGDAGHGQPVPFAGDRRVAA
jgi:hypothetical protein